MPHHQLLVRSIVLEPKLEGVMRGPMDARPTAKQKTVKSQVRRFIEDDSVRRIVRWRVARVSLGNRRHGSRGKANDREQSPHTVYLTSAEG